MIPECKTEGIVFIRQVGGDTAMERRHSVYIYRDGKFMNL
jgi:hypothetical protein